MTTSPTRTAASCRICKAEGPHKGYQVREMMYGLREEFDYFECQNCGCLQIKEFPEDMAAYYPGNYYSLQPYDGKKFKGFKGGIKKRQYRCSVLGSKWFKKWFGIKEYRIFDGLNLSTQSAILDVGCGNGRNFLYPLAEVGFEGVQGCDPYLKETIQYENGLEITKSEIFDLEGSFDLITYHHAFEHLPNPQENLQKVNELLQPGGWCILRIPTVSSYAWKHYTTDWVQLDAPRHFFLHSQESISLLAEQFGFLLDRIVYDSNHLQFTGSRAYQKDIPLTQRKKKGFQASLTRQWDKWRFNRAARTLNRKGAGDQAAFFLRKK